MKCWNCGADMHQKEAADHQLYWQCKSCGATTTDLEKPLQVVAEETFDRGNGMKTTHIKARLTGRKKHATTNSSTSPKTN